MLLETLLGLTGRLLVCGEVGWVWRHKPLVYLLLLLCRRHGLLTNLLVIS